ncbi:MAG: lysylphosphatidylglycerol synthase domain-containing protein [Bacteroidota bacterium]
MEFIKKNKSVLFVVKLLLLLLMCYGIYSQLKNIGSTEIFTKETVFYLLDKSKYMLLLVLLLMPFNWLIEAMKWRYICKQHNITMSLKQAYAAVLFGACAGFISPGRWGEPIARAYYIGKERISQKLSLSLIGIISQWIITILFAFIAFTQIHNITYSFIFILLLLVSLILLFIYYEFIYISVIKRFSFLNQYLISASLIQDKWIVFLISLFRYSIYSLQYLLILSVFVPVSSLLKTAYYIFELFFIQSFSPFPGLIDYTVKNNIALYLFSNIPIQSMEILYSITVIWLINLVLPSVAGYVLFYKKINTFFKSAN